MSATNLREAWREADSRETRFRWNIVRIATGTAGAQAILMVATPFLTRLYAPEAFGAVAVFTAIHSAIACIFTLKYELSIILPEDNRKAFDLTTLTLTAALAASLLLFLILGGSRLLFGSPADWYYLLLPASAVLAAVYTSAQQWGARASDYRAYARGQVVSSVTNVAVSFLLAFVATQVSGSLVIAYVAALAAGAFYLGQAVWRTGFGLERVQFPGMRSLVATAVEYRRFPLFVLPSAYLATLNLSVQPFVLQTMFALRDVGHYAIAARFLLVPGALIGAAVSEAFRPEFVGRLKDPAELQRFFVKTLVRLTAIGLPVFAIAFLVAPPLCSLVFGADYERSGVLLRYLCAGACAQFIAQPFGYVFVATGHVRLGLIVQTIAVVMPLLALVLGGLGGSIDHAVLAMSLVTAVTAPLTIALAWRCCRQGSVAHV